MSSDISLRILFARALDAGSRASNLSVLDNTTQELLVSALRDLDVLMQTIDASGLFSPNETLDDIPTGHLPYLLVEFVSIELEGRARTADPAERLQRLKHSQRLMRVFLDRLRQYGIIPDEEQKLFPRNELLDIAKRREIKIQQFKHEKILRSELEEIRARRGGSMTRTGSGDELDLIDSLLPPPSRANEQQVDDDDEDLRRVSLLVIRLIWARAQSHAEHMEQEMELLQNHPFPESAPTRYVGREDPTWRLDTPLSKGGPDGKGPLMDSSGKPLRPFTILSAGASQRSKLQAEVFRPDHRLPTMTIDEYLEEERRRGNFISGGGPQSQLAPTRSEQLAIDSEMDGAAEGEIKAEEKRQEEEGWARYTDLHPKGEGNTMNRG